MKKTLILTLATALAVGSITSCKKGDNDPFLSLKSRKGRISGEWNVSSFNTTQKSTNKLTSVTTTTVSDFNGSSLTTTTSYSDGSPSSTKVYSYSDFSYTYNKDNTYKMNKAYSYTEYDTTSTFSGDIVTITVHNISVTTEGNWTFVGKQKGDYKNKERFTTQETSYSMVDNQTITNKNTSNNTSTTSSASSTESSSDTTPSMGDINVLDQLKSKEMIISTSNSSNYNYQNTTTGGQTIVGSDTESTIDGTFTLSAK